MQLMCASALFYLILQSLNTVGWCIVFENLRLHVKYIFQTKTMFKPCMRYFMSYSPLPSWSLLLPYFACVINFEIGGNI